MSFLQKNYRLLKKNTSLYQEHTLELIANLKYRPVTYMHSLKILPEFMLANVY